MNDNSKSPRSPHPSAEEIAAQLGARKAADGWFARCPAPDDKHASLSIGTGDDGKLLRHGHAGCSFQDILKAAGCGHGTPTLLTPLGCGDRQ